MDIDGWTILLQAINFLVLVWLLRRFLYRPVLAVIAAREAETARTRAAAAEARTAAEAARRTVEEERAGLAAERNRLTAAAVAAAEAQRATLLEKARGEADRLLADARERIGHEREEALTALKAQALALGSAVSERLLHDVAAEATPLLFDRACAALEALPDERRRVLLPSPPRGEGGDPLRSNGEGEGHARISALSAPNPHPAASRPPSPGTGEGSARLLLVSAIPLDTATLTAWTARLSTLLGRPVALTLRIDPALVAGVELHFPSLILSQCWRDALAHAREEMVRDEDAHAIA